ncbi:MAG: TonB-dependent receptor [Gammaproteobacteria bacterium]|nr:TonB-dependent receptor [Gammaproteobacteria bacterium]
MPNFLQLLPTAAFASVISVANVLADTPEDITQIHHSPETIGIATGHQQPLNLAPAVATVITADELDAVGATTLSEALTLVPGLIVLYRPQIQGSHVIFRGIRADSSFNPDWLLMLDGIPQNDVLLGNQRSTIGEVPIQNIERIEVIRGPGSALYGTDAFAGTVNIITKTPSSVSNGQLRGRVGSFDTREVRLLQPGELYGAKSLLSMQYGKTDGFRPFFEEDRQTIFDQQFHTDASLAPSHAQSWFEGYQLVWDLEQGPWRTRLRRRNQDVAIPSIAAALDDKGWQSWDMNSVDLMYAQPKSNSDWNTHWNASWYGFNYDTHDNLLYPPGAFGGSFPDGVLDEFGYSENRLHTEATANYEGFSGHILQLGTGAELHRVTDVRERRNYRLDANGTPIPIGEVVDLTESEKFAPSKSERRIYFVYLQDEWALARDWTLTSGLRLDHYSDFGSATNPRLAVVWSTTEAVTTKFLVGRAFRAPTLLDLYAQNNLVTKGNPDLDPEEITTYEIAFDYRPTSTLRTGLNLFHHHLTDKILATKNASATTLQGNGEGQEGNGGELEFRWDIANDVRLSGWYAYQRNLMDNSDTDAGFAPHRSANLRLDWTFLPNWIFGTNMRWLADRHRAIGDTRPNVEDYAFMDATVRYRSGKSPWSTALSIFNVFDSEGRDPSGGSTSFQNDYLLPPRGVFFEVRYER